MSQVSISREARVMFAGRGVTIVLSLLALVLFPRTLGPEAHGWFQYYSNLSLLLLGFLNGCAAPMAAHFVPLYRVSEPQRQGVLLVQLFRWYVLLLLMTSLARPLLMEESGFWWIFLASGAAGLAQLISSAVYGLGRMGPITWFPVLILFLRILFICGIAAGIEIFSGRGNLPHFGEVWIPVWMFLTTLPSLLWMGVTYFRNRSEWFQGEVTQKALQAASWLPWTEIGRFGLATVLGQIVYQIFTRTLTVIAMQWGYPTAHVGYLGLATQGFGQVVFLAGIFSVSVYPWMVSAWKAGESERFARLQSEAWRLCALVGGWLVACMITLIRPLVLVFLGPEYHGEVELIVELVRIGAVAGALMLAGEFHLRILLAQTEMNRYLGALAIGFSMVSPYLLWVLWAEKDIDSLAWTLPLGVACMTLIAVRLAPKTTGFYRTTLLAVAGGALSGTAVHFLESDNLTSLVLQTVLLTILYAAFAWGVGLGKREDLDRLRKTPAPKGDLPPEVGAE
jgi:O-antigen/teichoic acid export membrane protein